MVKLELMAVNSIWVLNSRKFSWFVPTPEDRVDDLNAACELCSWPDQQRYQITQILAEVGGVALMIMGVIIRHSQTFQRTFVYLFVMVSVLLVLTLWTSNLHSHKTDHQNTQIVSIKILSLCCVVKSRIHGTAMPTLYSRDEAKTDLVMLKKNQFTFRWNC